MSDMRTQTQSSEDPPEQGVELLILPVELAEASLKSLLGSDSGKLARCGTGCSSTNTPTGDVHCTDVEPV
ncbi:hypothetical protein [Streptomyces sp. NPDC051211]|uniref:hypothetical protein n=1 Tax=Streptomyces sp. NPDC051211 TaxID=3154643 RepID=UPI00345054E5